LLHLVKDKLTNPDLDIEDIRDVTRQYDELLEQIETIPNFIKNCVRKMYMGKKYLPIILCEISPVPSKPPSEAYAL
jgi:hypothetical protein